MIQEEQLRQIVGHFLQVPPENLTAGTKLGGNLAGSLGRARLDAALRNQFGMARVETYTAGTFGQLAEAICGGESISARPGNIPREIPEAVRRQPGPAPHAHAVGIDIEALENFPEAADYWDSPFYKTHFTNTEIGYALLQPNSLETFAGLWSAKEAFRKTAREWARLDWQSIEVAHDPDGSPYLAVQGADLRPEYSTSISHTSQFSAAVVVRAARVETRAAISMTAPARTPPAEKQPPTKSIRPIFLFLGALLASLWYLLQTHRW
jgi:phosphopantetheine--protein transferase-like protein